MNYYSALRLTPIGSRPALYTRLTPLWMGLRRESGLEAKRLANLIQMFQTGQVNTGHLTQ